MYFLGSVYDTGQVLPDVFQKVVIKNLWQNQWNLRNDKQTLIFLYLIVQPLTGFKCEKI